jgi:hypothetical protein
MLLSRPVVALLLDRLLLARRDDADRPDLFALPLRAVERLALGFRVDRLALDLRVERLALDLRAVERLPPDLRDVDRLPPDLLDELFLAAISLALLLQG